MDVVVLTVVCLAGLGLAVAAVVAWGGPHLRPEPLVVLGEVPPLGVTLRRLVRSLSIVVVVGGAAGMLTAGLGGRLMMRILAATSDDRVQGFATEADETIGEITFGGSVGLVVFIGFAAGFLGGIGYLAIRRWLPATAWQAGLVMGGLAIGLAPAIDALDPDSVDFLLLAPDLLSVVLIVALFPLWGMTLASMIERAERGWPEPAWTPLAVTAYLPLLLFIPGAVMLAVVAVIGLAVLGAQRIDVLGRLVRSHGFDVAGRAALAALVLLAVAWAGVGVVDILTGEDLASRP
jgi:hypothetical protein